MKRRGERREKNRRRHVQTCRGRPRSSGQQGQMQNYDA